MTRPSANPTGHPRSAAVVPVPPPSGPVKIPPHPETFDNDQIELWNSLWAVGAGVYSTSTHRVVITRYVEMTARRRDLMRILDEEGWMVVGLKGQTQAHPAARLLDSLEGRLVALEDRLGLSPEASIRLGLATVEVKSKLDAFRDSFG